MKTYPSLKDKTANSIAAVIDFITRQRTFDVTEWNTLPSKYVLGRKVNKIPTGSADVDPSDRLGDVNYTATYFYVLIDNAGTAEWRRAALSSW